MLKELKSEFFDRANIVTRLITINVVIYFLYLAIPVIPTWFSMVESYSGTLSTVAEYLGMPSDLVEFVQKPWTIFTYMFMHSPDPFHILFNIIFLYFFGKLLLEFIGSKHILPLYFLGGFAGAFIYALTYNLLPMLADARGHMVGASASIMAIVFAITYLKPDYTVRLFLLNFAIKLKHIALLMVVLDFLGTVSTNAGGAFAHLGGGGIGLLFMMQLQKGKNITSPIVALIGLFQKKEKKAKMTIVQGGKTMSKKVVKKVSLSQDYTDAILDKINNSGINSLTEEEKAHLKKMSE